MSNLFLIHLVHILIFSNLLFYVGIMGAKLPEFMFPMLIFIGIGVLGYHIYKAFSNPKYAWVNYIHIFLIAPLLVLIGVYGKETSYIFFEYCLMLGFASLGYHGYYIFKEITEIV
jgi:hypothetical protein